MAPFSLSRLALSIAYLLLPEPTTQPLLTDDKERGHDDIRATQQIIRSFLRGLNFVSPRTPQNDGLRRRLAAEIASWNIDVSATFTDKMLHNSCNMAECTSGHTSAEHQYFVALYTAFTFYADDHCGADPEPIGQFAQRFSEGAPQLDPVLDRFAAHIRRAFDLWPRIGANAIISGTFDSMTAMYIEYTTTGMAPIPGATRYPYYVRTKSGIIPEMDYFINCTNDILSFYKETLAGETDNYIHLRAAAERKSPSEVLRILADEVTDTVRRIDAITSADPELAALWQRYLQVRYVRRMSACVI
ncbi:terpenoid synthase [Epithele typhae]|uniref:terpenoid synthase n=1 Tax=Epithele typhae TaxID=378194 RepID=UPI002008CF2F|nr:terpenoid synthase [Epithele typhae]KAH9918245.1 terpenoid synthase [Epithele typhae]